MIRSNLVASQLPLAREPRMWCEARGLSFFCDGCGDREVRCNGRSELLTLRKASGIVQM